MNQYLLITQAIVAVLLIIFIILQQRGGSLGSVFGGTGEFYATRRGAEKKIFWGTVILGAAFIILALLNLIL